MPKQYCVEDPQLQEIMDVLQHLGFEYVVEASRLQHVAILTRFHDFVGNSREAAATCCRIRRTLET